MTASRARETAKRQSTGASVCKCWGIGFQSLKKDRGKKGGGGGEREREKERGGAIMIER